MPNVSIQSASNGLHPHRYNPITVASLDYGELLVNRRFECEKSDDWKRVKSRGNLRLAALDFPAYGRSYIKSAAFFVPYYQLSQNIDGIRSNMVTDKGQSCVVPHITTDAINSIFAMDLTNHDFASIVWEGTVLSGLPTTDQYDISCISRDGTNQTKWHLLKMTSRGRRLYKFFKMLGYDYRQYTTSNDYDAQVAEGFNVNAYTLLAYCKVYVDYFMNVHLYNTSWLVEFLRAVKDGNNYSVSGTSYYNASNGLISVQALVAIFNEIQLPYESNLYLDAWNSENSPTGVLNSQSVNPNNVLSPHLPLTANAASVVTRDYINNNATGISLSDLNSQGVPQPYFYDLSQLGLNTLYAVFEFVRRNNLFGSEAAKQAFARFGIKGDDFNTYFARKLFEDSQEIDFSAVMSNTNNFDANTQEGSYLGAYAGVGLGSFNFDYNYQCSDYGVVLNLNWIQFNMLQMHGFDPAVLRMHAFDWFTPEFDGKAQRAVPMCEIGACKKPINAGHNNNDTNVFGFIGLYDEYRTMRDEVLGDFCVGFAKNFVFGRDLSHYREQSNTHISPQTKSIQYYNRYGQNADITDPFQFSNENGDRFYIQMIWEIEASRPILSSESALMLNGPGDINANTSGNQTA